MDQIEARALLQPNESMVCQCWFLHRHGFYYSISAHAHGLQPAEAKAREDLTLCGVWSRSFVGFPYRWVHRGVDLPLGSLTH